MEPCTIPDSEPSGFRDDAVDNTPEREGSFYAGSPVEISGVFDTLREAGRGLDIEEIAAAVMKAEGIEADDPETLATISQHCTVAMYRYHDKGRIVKERWGAIRVWRLSGFKGPHLLRG